MRPRANKSLLRAPPLALWVRRKSKSPMLRRLALVIICLGAFLGVCARSFAAQTTWTFCVAESGGGRDIWISSVFVAPRDRERLEAEFANYLRSRGVVRPIVQCPAGKDDKTDVVNAQTVAAEFHSKLGDELHEVTAPEFEPKR